MCVALSNTAFRSRFCSLTISLSLSHSYTSASPIDGTALLLCAND